MFCIALFGMLLNKKHIMLLFVYIELMLLAISTNFIVYAKLWNDIHGQIIVLFILTVSVIEMVVAWAMLIKLFRMHGITSIDTLSYLKDEAHK
jgi:NADH-quinone oxidoreductase subunit K